MHDNGLQLESDIRLNLPCRGSVNATTCPLLIERIFATTGLSSLVVIIGVIVAVHFDSSGDSSGISEDRHPFNNRHRQKMAKNVCGVLRFNRIEYTEWS